MFLYVEKWGENFRTKIHLLVGAKKKKKQKLKISINSSKKEDKRNTTH